ncbi:MAG: oligopeptide/dipeptide ABC transporter ATP-binding protein [Acutalibacteraceae bacterium]
MYGGKIVETGLADEIYYEPQHPYTSGLLACVNNPEEDTELRPIPGSPPDLIKPPAGCPFVDRCDKAMKICKMKMPPERNLSDTHAVCCWLTEKPEAIRKGGE